MIESNVCIMPMVTDTEWELLRLHNDYQGRLLPLSGGLYDQPHAYLEAMRVISDQFGRK